jgi:hemerythrin-like domain-containing protein
VTSFAEFFRNFADRCHHGKEEDRLFATMARHGFPAEYGPIAVMLAEHTEGRRHVAALTALGAGEGPLTEADTKRFVEHATEYGGLLRAHIQKEDQILYPMAEQQLPSEVLGSLAEEFELFEQQVMGAVEHERYHALAEELIERFPVACAPGFSCPSCCTHA